MLRRLTFAFLFVLLALAGAGFVRLNGAAVTVDLYAAAVPTSIGEALVAAFAVGWVAGVGGARLWMARLVRERRELARALRLAEGEVKTLRAAAPSHAR
jgi:hypothetical protein